jgi:hypothetical protein
MYLFSRQYKNTLTLARHSPPLIRALFDNRFCQEIGYGSTKDRPRPSEMQQLIDAQLPRKPSREAVQRDAVAPAKLNRVVPLVLDP